LIMNELIMYFSILIALLGTMYAYLGNSPLTIIRWIRKYPRKSFEDFIINNPFFWVGMSGVAYVLHPTLLALTVSALLLSAYRLGKRNDGRLNMNPDLLDLKRDLDSDEKN
jgi:hypothetical protein